MTQHVRRWRLSGLLGTRAAFVATLAICLLTLLWSYQEIEDRAHAHFDASSLDAAEMVTGLLTDRHLIAEELATGRLGDDAARRLRQDVAQFRSADRLHAFRAWQLDGTIMFLDVDRTVQDLVVSASDMARASAGESWTTHGQDLNGNVVLQAFVPFAGDDGDPVAVLELVLPHEPGLAAMNGGVARQQVIATAVLLPVGAGLLALRRRLMRREREARDDQLTGLLNRRALLEDGQEMVRRATADRMVGLLLLDLDDFKVVNDTLGHTAGDVLLQRVATVLSQGLRADDLVVRLGGDEFAVLLPDLPSAAAGRQRAEELLRQLQVASFVVGDVGLVVDATVGVALAPRDGTTVEELLQRADIAMYQAKRRGAGVNVYDNTADEHSIDQLETVSEFRRALGNGELVLHYQPKVTVADGETTSAEALVRWQHPTRGLLLPGQFLPLVEGTGLMAPLTRWVLRAAIEQAAQWRCAGIALQVAVNISPDTLLERELPARLLSLLVAADLPPHLLQLEITETAIMTDPRRAALTVAQLRDGGIEVLVDDFGAGYTSLAHLRTLPITGFKLDRSLITRMLDDPQALAVVEALIDLGHRLGLQVIAEGVETELLLERLAALGCDEAQGYVISRPVAADELQYWLVQRAMARPLLC